jgi:hypothetical protein
VATKAILDVPPQVGDTGAKRPAGLSALQRKRWCSVGGGPRVGYFGPTDLRAQAEVPSVLRSDIHEEASVKTGARRLRDFPDIHSASAAQAARH